MKSIKVRMAVVFLTIIAAALGILAGLNYWEAKGILISSIEEKITAEAEREAEGISLWLDLRRTEVAMIASSPIIAGGNRDAMVAYLGAEVRSHPLYEAIFVTDATGKFINSEGQNGSIGDRDYFPNLMKGNAVVSDPVASRGTGKPVVVIAVPITAGGKVVGAVGGAVNIEDINKRILGVKVGQTGYAVAVRGDGLTIVHPDKELANKMNALKDANIDPALKAGTEKMVKGEQGLIRYSNAGVEKYMAFSPVAGSSWSIGVVAPVAEMAERLNAFTWTAIIAIVGVLAFAGFVIVWVAGRIAKPIQQLEAIANKIADGDITIANIAIESDDELGRLGQSIERMSSNLRELIKKIMGTTDQVAASAEELTANAGQSAQAASQVASSVSEAAKGTEKQTGTVINAVALVERIAAGTKRGADDAQKARQYSDRAVKAAAEGNDAVDVAIKQMNNIQTTVEDSARFIIELGDRSKEIGQIVEAISGIAGQTNLLALNAAIEAARAGEHGRGFAVVAEEVRKLAEQSQEAAKQISTLIGDIQAKTDRAVTAMTNGTQEVSRGTEVVDKAGKAFGDIAEHIREVAGLTQGVAGDLASLVGNSQEVLEAVKEIDLISRNIAGETQTISAATEEQTASMEEIASSSQSLAQLAQELLTAVQRFKV